MTDYRLPLALATALLLTCAATAQTVPPAAPGGDPTRLPGDGPPPSLGDMLRPMRHAPGDTRPANGTPSPPLTLSIEAAQAAIDACKVDGLLVAVVVTDAAGNVRAGLVADGAAPGEFYVAVQKSLTAIAFREPTSAVQAQLRADPSAASKVRPNMMIKPGALPIIVGNQLLGAIGVSGAMSQQDQSCATAGAEKIMAELQTPRRN